MTANPATACAVLVRVFTDTLNVVCLRGLNPFLPTPRGSPVTIESHMRNASTFPPASATRPRKVVQFRYARPESGILTTILFDLSSITPARPLSGAKRYTRARPPPIGGKTVQVGKSLCTCQTSRRTPSGLHAIWGAPASYTVDAVPVKASGEVPFLDCVHSIAPCTPYVNRFLKNIFRAVFFKDNENARARSGSQNRRKQTKTWVLSA